MIENRYFALVALALALSSFSINAYGAWLHGTVQDEKGDPLPFANIYLSGSTQGAVSNTEGKYELYLPDGEHMVLFQFVGFEKQIHVIQASGEERIELNVVLKEQGVLLAEAVVESDKADRAMKIMKEVIKKRKYHRDQVKAYSCDSYMKGSASLDELPDRILGFKVDDNRDSLDKELGLIYLSESESKLYYEYPDNVKEVMYSSSVSGDEFGFSWNQASDLLINFYDNLIEAGGISERGFISPVADNAMFFYKYQLQGSYLEDGHWINKIRVIPRRANDPVFQGMIYIVDSVWRIHSVDLMLTKKAQLEFVDTLRIKKVYVPVTQDIWMPLSQSIRIYFSLFGIKGSGDFIGFFRNYDVQPEFEEKFFNNEIMVVKADANKKDRKYWESIRPVPLTSEEIRDYEVKDSLTAIYESKPYRDSMDRKNNKFDINEFILGGYSYNNSYSDERYFVSGLLSSLQYNTVEGWVANSNLSYTKELEDRRRLSISPTLRYGFANKRFNAKVAVDYLKDPVKRAAWRAEAGQFVRQYNRQDPISPLINSFYTLVEGQNYMKLYQEAYAAYGYREELVNGLTASASVRFAERSPLVNSTAYSFRSRETKSFTSNNPIAPDATEPFFSQHQALTFKVGAEIKISQKYITRPDGKVNLGSDYPTLELTYRKGINGLLGSDVNFDEISARIYDDLSFGLVGSSSFSVLAGTFINDAEVPFMDRRHFMGNQTGLAPLDHMSSFYLLPYYTYSTVSSYLEGHFEHHFNGFIFNKLPLLRKLKWQAVGGVSVLMSEGSDEYLEVSAGIEHILKFMRVDFVAAFQRDQRLSSGIVIGIGF